MPIGVPFSPTFQTVLGRAIEGQKSRAFQAQRDNVASQQAERDDIFRQREADRQFALQRARLEAQGNLGGGTGLQAAQLAERKRQFDVGTAQDQPLIEARTKAAEAQAVSAGALAGKRKVETDIKQIDLSNKAETDALDIEGAKSLIATRKARADQIRGSTFGTTPQGKRELALLDADLAFLKTKTATEAEKPAAIRADVRKTTAQTNTIEKMLAPELKFLKARIDTLTGDTPQAAAAIQQTLARTQLLLGQGKTEEARNLMTQAKTDLLEQDLQNRKATVEHIRALTKDVLERVKDKKFTLQFKKEMQPILKKKKGGVPTVQEFSRAAQAFANMLTKTDKFGDPTIERGDVAFDLGLQGLRMMARQMVIAGEGTALTEEAVEQAVQEMIGKAAVGGSTSNQSSSDDFLARALEAFNKSKGR